jgi:hypothetical protein
VWKCDTVHIFGKNDNKCHVVCSKSTDFSEEHSTSIFMVKASGKQSHMLSCWFRAWLSLWPWIWRWCVPPKHRLNFSVLHGVISHKKKLVITSAVRTSNPTNFMIPRSIYVLCWSSFSLLAYWFRLGSGMMYSFVKVAVIGNIKSKLKQKFGW